MCPCCISDDESVLLLGNRTGKVSVLLAMFIMVGFCDRDYSAQVIFELVNGLWGDQAVEACQLVAEGDQRAVRCITFGCCHSCVLLLFLVGENTC